MELGINQSSQRPGIQPVPPQTRVPRAAPPPKKSRLPQQKVVIAGALLALLLVLGLFWSWWLFGRNTPYNDNKGIETNQFQAIFLTNGQVYFGKLSNLDHKYVTITDVFYLQVQSNSSLQGASNSASPSSQVSLVKLGNELHGPEDKMYIANDQMLFWENLKDSSKVVQAIDKYQNQ
jgi:hypothetical protein